MKLANIFPLGNQNLYSNESYVMILAQILDRYNPEYFHPWQWIILDNGLYEKEQATTDLQYYIELADKSDIPISEIIIPDSFYNKEETEYLFKLNLPIIHMFKDKYSYMYVAQSENIKEFEETIDFINSFSKMDLPITVGIPKKAPFDRESKEAIRIYKKCKYPIHFLGLTDTTPIKNLHKVDTLIRSCDTSQICHKEKNSVFKNPEDILSYVRTRYDKPIDLREDNLEESNLISMTEVLEKEFND